MKFRYEVQTQSSPQTFVLHCADFEETDLVDANIYVLEEFVEFLQHDTVTSIKVFKLDDLSPS